MKKSNIIAFTVVIVCLAGVVTLIVSQMSAATEVISNAPATESANLLKYDVGAATEKTQAEPAVKQRLKSKLNLNEAILLGSKKMQFTAVVLLDPASQPSKLLYDELITIVAEKPQIAFYLVIYPGSTSASQEKAAAILCNKSIAALEMNFKKETVTKTATCASAGETIEQVKTFAKLNGITETPTIIWAGGTTSSGVIRKDEILRKLAAF